jgi:hypothetical protein
MRRLLAAFAVLAALSVAPAVTLPASAQKSTKEQDIRTLIELSGAARIATQMVNAMMPQMRDLILKMRPEISKAHLDLLLGEFTQVFAQSAPKFVETMVPLYEQRFTQQEIRDVVAFYRTPTGQKMLAELPGLMNDGMRIGQQWGQAVAQLAVQRIQTRIKELGI